MKINKDIINKNGITNGRQKPYLSFNNFFFSKTEYILLRILLL